MFSVLRYLVLKAEQLEAWLETRAGLAGSQAGLAANVRTWLWIPRIPVGADVAGAPVVPVLGRGRRENAGPRGAALPDLELRPSERPCLTEEGGKGPKKISSAGLWPSVCRHTLPSCAGTHLHMDL